jgi:hypothetical protein
MRADLKLVWVKTSIPPRTKRTMLITPKISGRRIRASTMEVRRSKRYVRSVAPVIQIPPLIVLVFRVPEVLDRNLKTFFIKPVSCPRGRGYDGRDGLSHREDSYPGLFIKNADWILNYLLS